jgi:Uma2 family endonuclease
MAATRLPIRTVRVYDPPMTLAEFERLPTPLHGGKLELRQGRVVEMAPAGYLHGRIQIRLGARLERHVEEQGGTAFATVQSEVGYRVDPEGEVPVRAPDVAVLLAPRGVDPLEDGFVDGAPDLAVEIRSPYDEPDELAFKVEQYLRAGAQLVWVIHPPRQSVPGSATVYRARGVAGGPGGSPTVLGPDDFLVGDPVLPGFRLRLSDLWA